jgi:hypothetical protein
MKYKVKIRITDLSGESRKLAFNLDDGMEFLLGKKTVKLREDVCVLAVVDGQLEARKPKGVENLLTLNRQSAQVFAVKPGDIVQGSGYAVEFIEAPHVVAAGTQFVDISSLKMDATRVGDQQQASFERSPESEPHDEAPASSDGATRVGSLADEHEHESEPEPESESETEPEAEGQAGARLPGEEELRAAAERERQRERELAAERSRKLAMREKEERAAAERARALARRTEESQSQTRFTRYFHKGDSLEETGEVTRFAKLTQDRTELAVSLGMVFFFCGLAAVAGRFSGFFPGAVFGTLVVVMIASGVFYANAFFKLRHTIQDYLNILAYVSLATPVAAYLHTRDAVLGSWCFGVLFLGAFGALFHKFKPEPKRFVPAGVSISAAVVAMLLSIPRPVEIEVATTVGDSAAPPSDRQPAEAWDPSKVVQGQAAQNPVAQAGAEIIKPALEPKDQNQVMPAWAKPVLEERRSVPDPLASEQYFTAIREGNLSAVKDLVARRAVDPSFTLEKGNTGLMIAASTGKLSIVKFLVSKRVSLNAQDPNGTTALMWAVYRNHRDIVEFLVERGANLDLRRDDGDRAEDLARRWNRVDIVRVFEGHRAELAAREAERAAKAAKLARQKQQRSGTKRLPAGNRTQKSPSSKTNYGKIRSLRPQ